MQFFNILKVQFKIMTKKWGFNVVLFIVFIFCISSYLNNAFTSVNKDISTIYSSDSFFALNTSTSLWGIFKAIYPFLIVFPFAFSYFVYGTDGFSIDEFENPIYTNVKNIMKKDLSYLIFLEPSLLNQYEQTSKSYCLFGSFFSYLNIENINSEAIKEPFDSLQFNHLKNNEFFASSNRILDCIQIIKEKILQKYLLLEINK